MKQPEYHQVKTHDSDFPLRTPTQFQSKSTPHHFPKHTLRL